MAYIRQIKNIQEQVDMLRITSAQTVELIGDKDYIKISVRTDSGIESCSLHANKDDLGELSTNCKTFTTDYRGDYAKSVFRQRDSRRGRRNAKMDSNIGAGNHPGRSRPEMREVFRL